MERLLPISFSTNLTFWSRKKDREVAPKELEMAKKLIDAMTTEWEPTKYKDQYQTAVMEMIENKAAHRAPSAKPETTRAPSNVVDLVAVLQQSLQNAGTRKKQPERESRPKSTAAVVKQKRRTAA